MHMDTQLSHPSCIHQWLLFGYCLDLGAQPLVGYLHCWEVGPREEVFAGPGKMLRDICEGNLEILCICHMVY